MITTENKDEERLLQMLTKAFTVEELVEVSDLLMKDQIKYHQAELKNHKDLHNVSVCSWDKICIVKTKKDDCRKNCKYDTRKL